MDQKTIFLKDCTKPITLRSKHIAAYAPDGETVRVTQEKARSCDTHSQRGEMITRDATTDETFEYTVKTFAREAEEEYNW